MTGIHGRPRPWVPFVVQATAVTLGALALRLRDPHQQGSWGTCPSAALGIDCPGCGGLRAVNLLTHGDVAGAASSNLLVVIALPVLTLWWGTALVRALRGSPRPWRLRLPAAATWVGVGLSLAVLVAFTVLRNLSGLGAWAAWLAP